NTEHMATRSDNSNLAARISSYELAYRMQTYATEAVDLSQETQATTALYGIGEKRTEDFGRRCLFARRLVERGVRFVQLYSGGATTTPTASRCGPRAAASRAAPVSARPTNSAPPRSRTASTSRTCTPPS